MARSKKQARKSKAKKRSVDDTESDPPAKLLRCDSENTQLKAVISAVQQEASTSVVATSSAKVDSFLWQTMDMSPSARVTGEYSCMLNQTDVINNNNKFYIIQIAEKNKQFLLFTRWGRVGEDGQNTTETFKSIEDAAKGFRKKFQSKTSNNWEKRDNFVAKAKKYTLLCIDVDEDSDGDQVDAATSSAVGSIKKTAVNEVPCNLDYRSQIMIKLIFSEDMFKNQMTEMNLDIRKMPLGKLSKVQITKGLAALIEIEEALKNKKSHVELAQLSSKFFTLIPHNFGRTKPPILSNDADVRTKKELMITLADIELTQNLQTVKDEASLHPLDVNYESLHCDMELLPKASKEFKLICKYVAGTNADNKPVDVWRLDRDGEASRFSAVDAIGNRKLLWHGTNVVVVAAVLNSGLRIMPHSGGRLGRGIYMASEYSKSAGYTGCYWYDFEGEKNVAFMFLSEVALGRMSDCLTGDGGIVAAPDGYDSVVGPGQKEPDPKSDATLNFDNHSVTVPVGKPVRRPKYKDSNFDQSEYLVYREDQVRLRFLVKFVLQK